MSKGRFTTEARRLIEQRAKGFCEYCALPLGRNAHLHHRQPRGIGGTSTETAGQACNALRVHPQCHAKIEANREEAYRKGWLVRKPLHPATVPVWRWGNWTILHLDGSISVVELPHDHDLQQRRARR